MTMLHPKYLELIIDWLKFECSETYLKREKIVEFSSWSFTGSFSIFTSYVSVRKTRAVGREGKRDETKNVRKILNITQDGCDT